MSDGFDELTNYFADDEEEVVEEEVVEEEVVEEVVEEAPASEPGVLRRLPSGQITNK